ncbi:uncharacterized protein LOC119122065 isoform X2 [Syngnathus acus]|uniref:uncharacterized protein LOC119122065 isoform X2 n=1 Tax=Syngnathus acus TaxID=161584 RepID=UPI001885D47C|nr:uncharacterized protein LOC119122065 isoform X2 [Syngnathus acus]
MKMSLKPPALVLLTVCVAAAAKCSALLNETQARVDILVGSSLTLCYRLRSQTPERFRICWHFNESGSLLDHSKELFCSKLNRSVHKDMALSYTLSNINARHSGWYFCRIHVDIPNLTTMNSSGTQVYVHVSLLNKWWLWITVGILCLILVALMILCVHQIRRRQRRKEAHAVYVNTHHSTRPPALGDQLRVAPSSQMARTPSPARDKDRSRKQRPK